MHGRADTSSNPHAGLTPAIGDLIGERISRRGALAGFAATGLTPLLGACATTSRPAPAPSFTPLPRMLDDRHHVAEGHAADVLIRWGDALFDGLPTFDPTRLDADEAERRFGFNNDYIGFIDREETADGGRRAILCVNHEYSNLDLMAPGAAGRERTAADCELEKASHGGSILEIERVDGRWRVVTGAALTRRISSRTPMTLAGPAAGHARLRTTADPDAAHPIGTFNNCAGGITPWGTYLMAEENFDDYFIGEASGEEAASHRRYDIPSGRYRWGRFDRRFDLSAEPREPNRFGWVVEVDPLDPASTPVKRTALGRFKHEGAESVLAPSGRVVVYMGDDQCFDYLYKYVSDGRFDPTRPESARGLLDEGTLYVARFDADGGVTWLPLVHGFGPLTPANGLRDQGEVLIEARRAADLLGATPMDRPEDVQPDAARGRVFVMLTNNGERREANVANPRADNRYGHIVEIVEPDGDFAATRSRWEILVRCGDPYRPQVGATWAPGTGDAGWFGSPDNAAIDPSGGLWVATDGDESLNRCANGLWSLGTDGAERGRGRLFFLGPVGSEICGPRFSDDGGTLFLSVQHPGEDDPSAPSSWANPSTRWPDFRPDMPPRPSVMAISMDHA